MLKQKVIVSIILLIFLAVFANAATLEGQCSIVTNQCDLSIETLELCNNSAGTQTYSTSTGGEAANWVNVIPGNVTLAEGECTNLRLYTIANCYAEPGIYNAEIIVKNGSTESVNCQIEITQGHEVGIDISPGEEVATQCEAKTYEIELENNSTVKNQQTEKVSLEVKGLPSGWYSLEEETVLVGKDNPVAIELEVQAPCDAEFGAYDFEVEAGLVNQGFSSTASASHIISQGQEISIVAGNNYDACIEEGTASGIMITNLGKLDDEIELGIEGPRWIELSDYGLVLDNGESKEIEILFNGTIDEEGYYGATITARSREFGYTTSAEFEVRLKDCYGLEIETLEGPGAVCSEEEPEYVFRLTNNRAKSINADISISGIEAELSQDSVSLSPGETRDIEATLDVAGLAGEAAVNRRNVAVEIIMDTSGSMMEDAGNEEKIESAKEAVKFFANNVTEVDLGLRVFGQEEGCAASELLVPISQLNIAEITESIGDFSPKGLTPIADSLGEAAADFSEGKEKNIILVSDGRETCKGDLEAAAKELASKGIVVYAIGFDIDSEGRGQLEMIANETSGTYFNAGNSNELLDVFRQITRELDIVPASRSETVFSLDIVSDNFSHSESFTIEVNDCYNVALSAPALNLCRGINEFDFVGINNLGIKSQEFEIFIEPNWVDADNSVALNGNSETLVSITVNVPMDATEEYITVTVASNELTATEKKPLNYLSDAACYGFDLIIHNYELDAAACEGKTQTLTIENRGKARQVVSISTDRQWVYLDEDSVELDAGERKDVYFLVSPPLDLTEGNSTITITAESDFGFNVEAELKVNILDQGFGLGNVEVGIEDVNLTKVIDANAIDVEVEFKLLNDSNRTMEIFSIEALDYEAVFEIAKTTLKKLGETTVKMLVDLPSDYAVSDVEVPISIMTDEGTFTRTIKFMLPGAVTPGDNGEIDSPGAVDVSGTVPIGVGLFTLDTAKNGIIAFLLIIIAALIVYSVLKATAPLQQVEKAPSIGEVTEKVKKPVNRKKIKKKKK